MKKSMFKGMAAILAFAIVLSLMPAAFAEGTVEIVSVFSQSGQDISKPIKVLALIPEGAENVTLSLGDTALTTAVTNSELYGEGYSVVSGTIPEKPTLGDNTLTLSADVGGANVSDESTITLRKYMYDQRVRSTDFTGMSTKTENEATATGAINIYPAYPYNPVVKDTVSGNEYYEIKDLSENGNGLSLYSNTSTTYQRYPYLNQGVSKEEIPLYYSLIEISFDMSVNKIGPAVYFRADQYETESFHFWSAKGDDYWFQLPLITSEGTICDSSVTVTPGESYTFTVILNRTTMKYDIYVNDEIVSGGRFDYFYASYTAPCFHRLTFVANVDGAKEEAVILDNINIDLYSEFPVSRGLSYTENGVLTEATENKVPISASSITARLYGASTTDLTNLEGNVYIEKPDGGMISCTTSINEDTASTRYATLTVTPSEVLDAGVNYKIIMNENVTFENKEYGSKTAIPFSTFAKFYVSSPADNAVVNIDEPLSVSATAPVGTTVKFLVDGVLKGSIQSLTGYVNAAIPTAGLTEGRKSLDVVVVYADGTTQTISRNISLRGFVKRQYMKMTNFELASGALRTEINPYGINWQLTSNYDKTENYISARSTEVIDRAEGDKAYMVKVTPLNSSQTFPMPASSTGMVNIWLFNANHDASPELRVSRVGQTAVLEFDVMFPDVLDYGLCVSPSNYRVDTIFKDGKLPDGTAIEAGRWYSIKIVDDFTACTTTSDKCKRSIYIDGKFAKSGTPSESAEKASGYEYVRIALIKNSNWTEEQVAAGERSAFAVDNVNLYTLVSIPAATDISYTKNDASVTASKVVPCDASSITVTFDRAFDADTMTAENVKLIVNGEDTNSAVAYDAVNNKLTVTPPANTLTKYADAKITLSSNITIKTLIATQALGKEVAIDLKIGDTENCFYAVTLSKTETDVIGKYEIINESGTAKTMKLFMPTYNTSESKLLSVDHEEFTLEPGKAIIKTLTNPLANADIAKALVWDEFLSPIVTIPAYSLK